MRWTRTVRAAGAALLAAAVAGAALPAQAAEYRVKAKQCNSSAVEPMVRIGACTWLLTSGKLTKVDMSHALTKRGHAYYRTGQYGYAISDYDQAIRLKPDDPVAYNALAWLLSTVTVAYYRDGARAVALAQKAVSLTDKFYTRDTLAAAYAEAGKFTEAAGEQTRVIAELRAQGRTADLASYQHRLNLYRNGRPFRQ